MTEQPRFVPYEHRVVFGAIGVRDNLTGMAFSNLRDAHGEAGPSQVVFEYRWIGHSPHDFTLDKLSMAEDKIAHKLFVTFAVPRDILQRIEKFEDAAEKSLRQKTFSSLNEFLMAIFHGWAQCKLEFEEYNFVFR